MGFQLIMGFFGMTMGFFGMNLGFFGKNMGFISDPTFITSKCTAIFEKVVLDLSILRRPIPRAVNYRYGIGKCIGKAAISTPDGKNPNLIVFGGVQKVFPLFGKHQSVSPSQVANHTVQICVGKQELVLFLKLEPGENFRTDGEAIG